MSATRYYRCDDKVILAVFDQVKDEMEAMQRRGSELAQSVSELTGHSCSAMYASDHTEYSLAGVRFEQFSESLRINFCKPMKSNNYMTWPKVKADPTIKALFQGLPRVDRRDCWKALGTDWGNLLFSPLGYIHAPGKYLYVQTSLDLTKKLTEITGGEYQQAEKEAA